MIRAELRPRGPYSLLRSGRLASDATRRVVDGTYRGVVAVDGTLELVRAAQRRNGTVVIAAESEAGVEHVRFVLGLDDDHSEFLRAFADDPAIIAARVGGELRDLSYELTDGDDFLACDAVLDRARVRRGG